MGGWVGARGCFRGHLAYALCDLPTHHQFGVLLGVVLKRQLREVEEKKLSLSIFRTHVGKVSCVVAH